MKTRMSRDMAQLRHVTLPERLDGNNPIPPHQVPDFEEYDFQRNCTLSLFKPVLLIFPPYILPHWSYKKSEHFIFSLVTHVTQCLTGVKCKIQYYLCHKWTNRGTNRNLIWGDRYGGILEYSSFTVKSAFKKHNIWVEIRVNFQGRLL